MLIDRRDLLNRTALAVVAGVAAGLMPSLSHALSEDEATAHVQGTITEIMALVRRPVPDAEPAGNRKSGWSGGPTTG